ncbi:COG4223 family protein [Rhizobium sp. B230/85]|uniref:COG4223 family protein n=1 Tax=unclassified Rhizobium TaxID=2613769 RepID=UPI001ADA4A0C|nr:MULTISPECIES: COG4223 family protein [unclassified Rhizobium]MBO9135702.1 COG4223 family protein [Rhizobium sp. B209b/85]MBO9170107.1 COG4223 family protein [Rhizobium sp. L245/93]QXZ96151.1 COG4223 family protein [Rhizobium sp. B230/85]
MIPGNPPHHTKPDEEPVTIDLEANEADRREAEIESHKDEIGTSATDTVDIKPQPEPEPEQAYEPAGPTPTEPPAPTATAPANSTTGLIAAGIVGGLIALIGAGALQYAGVLPAASGNDKQQFTSLDAEIDGLKQSVANLATSPAATPDAALEARIGALETAMKNNPQAATANGAVDTASAQKISDLTAEVDQLKASMTQTTQTQATTGADISKRLDDAEKKLNDPGKDVAVAQAIAAAGLKAAIDRGGPFRAELDTFAGVSPNDPTVETLGKFAETGVPSRAELIRQVPDVATTIIGATEKPAETQGWSDRLMESAKSLVTVRPVGNIKGDGVDAIAARFEDKIRNGDLPGAVSEWNSLPETGKMASAAFKQSIEARIKVEDLVGETLSKAIAGAGKQS